MVRVLKILISLLLILFVALHFFSLYDIRIHYTVKDYGILFESSGPLRGGSTSVQLKERNDEERILLLLAFLSAAMQITLLIGKRRSNHIIAFVLSMLNCFEYSAMKMMIVVTASAGGLMSKSAHISDLGKISTAVSVLVCALYLVLIVVEFINAGNKKIESKNSIKGEIENA